VVGAVRDEDFTSMGGKPCVVGMTGVPGMVGVGRVEGMVGVEGTSKMGRGKEGVGVPSVADVVVVDSGVMGVTNRIV
jgi:hypothetical protein